MKYKIETEEGEKIFLYEGLIEGNIYLTTSQFQVERNIKRIGITNEFSKRIRIVMQYDFEKKEQIVITTLRLDDNSKVQFLIDSKSNLDDCPSDLKPTLETAFKMRSMSSLNDLLTLTETPE